VSQLCAFNLLDVFDRGGCVIKRKDTNEVLLEGRREAGLYIYSHKNITLLTTPSSSEKSILAHRRLGHLTGLSFPYLRDPALGTAPSAPRWCTRISLDVAVFLH
jgi:hypothetical protein